MTKSVLIVDDHQMVLDALDHYISADNKIDVSCATTVAAALDQIKQRGAFDLVLADLRMPGTHGTQHLETLIRANAPGRVALMSGLATYPDLFAAHRSGIRCFIRKNIAANEMISAIQALLDDPNSVPQAYRFETVCSVPAGLENLLTMQDCAMLSFVALGEGNASVAQHLGLGVTFVSNRLRVLYRRLGVTTRQDAAAVLVQSPNQGGAL